MKSELAFVRELKEDFENSYECATNIIEQEKCSDLNKNFFSKQKNFSESYVKKLTEYHELLEKEPLPDKVVRMVEEEVSLDTLKKVSQKMLLKIFEKIDRRFDSIQKKIDYNESLEEKISRYPRWKIGEICMCQIGNGKTKPFLWDGKEWKRIEKREMKRLKHAEEEKEQMESLSESETDLS